MPTEDSRRSGPPPPPQLPDRQLSNAPLLPSAPKSTACSFVHDRPFLLPEPVASPELRLRVSVEDGSEKDRDGDDDDMEVYEEEDDEDEVEALVRVDDGNKSKSNINDGTGGIEDDKFTSFSSPCVGSDRGVILKDCNTLQSGHDNGDIRVTQSDNIQHRRVREYQNTVTIAEPSGSLFYQHNMHGLEGSGGGQKGLMIDNGCGISVRKDSSYSRETGESLRAILSDPITGALMDDAMILPCGHSFGSCGIQHVLRLKACYSCSQPVSEESVSQNLSLRAAIQAFRREEQLQASGSTKRKREQFEQDKGSYADSMPMNHPRSRSLQFPFAVTDRVIIKGNKRTPQRFVGREAIVTTQCLNGWYVVKTLDNAESVKLQYRSLAKFPDHTLSSNPSSSKQPSNWI